MFLKTPALVVVDMQRYYLEAASAFSRFHSRVDPGCLDYIQERCRRDVIPNTARLITGFRQASCPVVFLRLCGVAEDRSDLQQTFRDVHREAERSGYAGLYPLQTDPFSDVIPALASPGPRTEFCKTTYSAFTSTPEFEQFLAGANSRTLVFAGLATSQCVETTARDAADRNYRVVHVDDAQADYSEISHRASLYSSRGVCGGHVTDTDTLLKWLQASRAADL